MKQTVKFGRVRAKQDPDRTESSPGIYYGVNVVPRTVTDWKAANLRVRCTHGACVQKSTR